MFGEAAIYRFRPDGTDPEACFFEIWAVSLKPAHEAVPRAAFAGVFDKEDADGWPVIPRQDFSNIERQQRGLHSPAFRALRLSRDYEEASPTCTESSTDISHSDHSLGPARGFVSWI